MAKAPAALPLFCNKPWVPEMRSKLKFLSLTMAGLTLACGQALAQTPPTPPKLKLDLVATHSALTAGLPNGNARNLRLVADLSGGDSAQAELLDERKFGLQGGIVGVGYTRVLNPDWFASANLALGHGGPNWAQRRLDGQLSRKWLARQQLVTSVAVYDAQFDAGRSDRGVRLSASLYGDWPRLVEAGVLINQSHPGGVRSNMPYLSAVFGQDGAQVFTLRVASGREAYQALQTGTALVDFASRSLGATGRFWLGPTWGLTAQAEAYHNPSYDRRSLGLGVFGQW